MRASLIAQDPIAMVQQHGTRGQRRAPVVIGCRGRAVDLVMQGQMVKSNESN